MRSRQYCTFFLCTGMLGIGCGDSQVTEPPLDVELGSTAFVVLVNPIVNTANGVEMPEPGTTRTGISVEADLGTAVMTNADGVAVLNPITPGVRTVSLTGNGLSGATGVLTAEGDLHEIAVALTTAGAEVMADILYAFDGEVVEITPTTPIADVNAQLARSNVIVFLRGGTYTGDLQFTGSNVTLFGEGAQGGQVTINGNVLVAGSNNRIRGARITGNLTVPGSGAGISFSRVTGDLLLAGSSAVLLKNAFCGSVGVVGSDPTLLGNAGLAPIAAPAGGC